MIRRIFSATISPRSRRGTTSPSSAEVEGRETDATTIRETNEGRTTVGSFSGDRSRPPIVVSRQVDVNMQIRRAAEDGNVDAVKFLLDHDGASAKAHTRPGNTTALHCAAFRGHYHVVRTLLDYGADPNALDDFERTSLHRAARKGHKQVIRLLIDRGADVLMYDGSGMLASDLAAKKKFDPSVVALLREAEILAKLPRVPAPRPSTSTPPPRSRFYPTQLVRARWYDERTGTWSGKDEDEDNDAALTGLDADIEGYYPATIVKSHKNGYYEIDYGDGYKVLNVPVEKVKGMNYHNMVNDLKRANRDLQESLDQVTTRLDAVNDTLQSRNEQFQRCTKDLRDVRAELESSRDEMSEMNARSRATDGGTAPDCCVICVTAKRNVVLIPCRHLCVCADCSAHMQGMRTQVCPLCRLPIDSYIHVYT